MNGVDRVFLNSYICEFMWRQQNQVSRVEAFEQILLEIGRYYPAEDLKLVDLKTVVEDEFIIEEDFNFNQKDGTWTEEANDEEASGEEASGDETNDEEASGEEASGEEASGEEANDEEANHGSMESRISDHVTNINSLLSNLTISAVKQKSLMLEKSSFVAIKTSQESVNIVNSAIEKSDMKEQCQICLQKGIEKFCKGALGLSLHISKSHKRKNQTK